jgi:predicted dehydrogenase
MGKKINRKEFLKTTAIAGVGTTILPSLVFSKSKAKDGDGDFRNMVAKEDIDGVYIATPWEWHHKMVVTAIKNGIHVGTEVPAALTVDECWDLVNIS